MHEAVRQIIQKFALVTPGQRLIIGVSGGADSLALLHILNALAPRLGFVIHAATLDHLLRGDESAGDVRYVEQICEDWGIPLTVGQADIHSTAQELQLGIEAAARLARYDFLSEVAYMVNATTIAVAHHADDQAETVLMHLLRGAGIHGASGMSLKSPVPGHPDLSLIRPLLRTDRAAIEAYCQQHKLEPRFDSTNQDTTILRNGIRLDVLPFLEQYSSDVRPALARFAEIAAVEDDYLQQQLLTYTQSNGVSVAEQRVSIERKGFRQLHPALQRRLVLWAVREIGLARDTESRLILDAVEIGLRGKQGAIALLGGGFQLRVDYDMIYVELVGVPAVQLDIPLLPADRSIEIEVPSMIAIGKYHLRISFDPPIGERLFCRLAIPKGAIIRLRTCKSGDVFTPLGMNGHHQKLSRWFVNGKIPKAIRGQIPLIVVDGIIGAIYVNNNWTISESFAVRNNVNRIIYFEFLENS